jgi:hypothetical protein
MLLQSVDNKTHTSAHGAHHSQTSTVIAAAATTTASPSQSANAKPHVQVVAYIHTRHVTEVFLSHENEIKKRKKKEKGTPLPSSGARNRKYISETPRLLSIRSPVYKQPARM